MRRILTLAIAVLMLASACAGAPPEVPIGPDGVADSVLVTGRDIYSRSCKSCHGSSGNGASGPSLNNEKFDKSFPTVSDIVDRVSEGRRRMPSFSSTLSEAQITAVARYVREVL